MNLPDSDGSDITIDGTIKFCEDLNVNPEDVVLLALAYELKSPSMGIWERKGWVDGWVFADVSFCIVYRYKCLTDAEIRVARFDPL